MSDNIKKPTYKRQRFLLSFIRQLQSSVTSTDLQKLVFLYIMKEELEYYEFLPYKFGAYSFQLAEDIDILHRNGYLSVKNISGSVQIKAIGEFLQEDVYQIEKERGNKLICKAYQRSF